MRLLLENLDPGDFRSRRLVRLSTEAPDVVRVRGRPAAEDATHQLIPVLGVPFLTHLPEKDPAVSGEVSRSGFWEFAESVLLLAAVRPGMTVVDAGANLGYYTTLLARHLGPEGRVAAFEPEPANYEILLANCLIHSLLHRDSPRMMACPFALSDACGTAALHVYRGNFGLHSLTPGSPQAVGYPAESVPVRTTTLDHLRGFRGEGPAALDGPVGLIKADVQGGELPLLRGAEQTVRADRPALCLEFEPYLNGVASCQALVAWLGERGYARFRLFHSNGCAPEQVLRELARPLTAGEVLAEVEARRVGPYGTLFAWPEPR